MPFRTRIVLRPAPLLAAGLLLIVGACAPQLSPSLSLPADHQMELGPAGTPKRVKGGHLAADLENTAAYGAARRNRDYAEMARLFLIHRAALFKLGAPREDLRLIDDSADGLGHHHAKFQQVVGEVPVWQKTLSVHFNAQDQLYRVDGDYLPTPLQVDTRPRLAQAEARDKALAGIAGSGSGWKVEAGELIVFGAEPTAPRLAYRFTVSRGLGQREDRIVAADTGQLLKRMTRINK